jgi:hypothetical protein
VLRGLRGLRGRRGPGSDDAPVLAGLVEEPEDDGSEAELPLARADGIEGNALEAVRE